MNYSPQTAYCRPLVTNSESLDKTTNTDFKKICNPSVAKNESGFVMVQRINMLQYPCVHSNIQKYEEI